MLNINKDQPNKFIINVGLCRIGELLLLLCIFSYKIDIKSNVEHFMRTRLFDIKINGIINIESTKQKELK